MANTNVVPAGLFGPGILWLTRTDIANATPMNIGFINEFQYDFAFDTKQLFGQNQFALLAARGTAKCTGKMKPAVMSGNALNTALLGGTWTAGTQYDIFQATAAIPGTPYQITPTLPGSGTADTDLGAVNATTGVPYVKVASSPSTGQYSYASGVYTFAAADTGQQVTTATGYHFTTGATGESQTITNPPIGQTPTFQLDYKTSLYGAIYLLRFYQCIGSKWAMNHKITDFAMPEFDFEFFSNAAGNIGVISLPNQA